MLEPPGNPLRSDDPNAWERLIEALGPASLLVAIEGRLSAHLRTRLSAEDILQETLLHLWRDRRQIEWRGAKSFRALVLSMADNRIRDAADVANATKRGGGLIEHSLDASDSHGSRSTRDEPPPKSSSTPSRVAIRREQAEAMRRALEGLPDEFRDVVRLRAFEQLELAQIARRLGLGESAVRHRFRKGSALYAQRLRTALELSSLPRDCATDSSASSSP